MGGLTANIWISDVPEEIQGLSLRRRRLGLRRVGETNGMAFSDFIKQ